MHCSSCVNRISLFVNLILFCVFGLSTSDFECGGHITQWSGRITSPRYPDPYPTALNCVWVLNPPNSLSFTFKVVDFQLERSFHCKNDYLNIRWGNSSSSYLANTYCGEHEAPFFIRAPTGSVRLELRTDGSHQYKGFFIQFYISSDACPPEQPVACPNGKCIKTLGICDDENDCGDYSEEQSCDGRPETQTAKLFRNDAEVPEDSTPQVEETGEAYSTAGIIFGATLAFIFGISMVGFCMYKRRQRRNTLTSLQKNGYQNCFQNEVTNKV